MSLITITVSSTPTDMTLYDIDIDSSYDPLHSYFIRCVETTWDTLSTASHMSLSNLHVSVFVWITTPSKPLPPSKKVLKTERDTVQTKSLCHGRNQAVRSPSVICITRDGCSISFLGFFVSALF